MTKASRPNESAPPEQAGPLGGLCSGKPFPVNQKSCMVRGHDTAVLQSYTTFEATLSKEPFKKPWRSKPAGERPNSGRFERSGPRFQGKSRSAARPAEDGPLRLFGMHAVEAALRNPQRKINKLVLTENAERRLIETMGPLQHTVELTTPRDLDRILGADTVHQGAMIETEDLPEPEFVDLAENANGRPLLVLDQVTDPHNVGAILRSAAVFGAAGLVMTRRHSPPLNGVLAKSASGALELVPVALVQNLSRALQELKDAGFTLLGLDGTAEACIEDTDWTSRPIALVMGAEGKGLRELTQKMCDQLVKITTGGPIDSLNVSNAAAVALHTAAMARRK
jgi:23S rRNA (guanosine2251-2'-O)-methyltransferase